MTSELKYIIRYLKSNEYKYKMFDTQGNAENTLLALKMEGYHPSLYMANKVEVTYSVSIKETNE